MTGFIEKIKLYNFKKFEFLELEFNEDLNVLIGDNESGKSTILQAIDLVLSGSCSKVESLGIDRLMNCNAVDNFLTSKGKKIDDLPVMRIELFLSEQNSIHTNGKIYCGSTKACDGLSLICEPNIEYLKDISSILQKPDNPIIPFELYSISFKTFAGQAYNGYTKPYKSILLDSTSVNAELAAKQYVQDLYSSNVDVLQRSINRSRYRSLKHDYETKFLQSYTLADEYHFTIKNSKNNNLESDLTLSKGNVDIDNQGRGLQCFVKARLALSNSKDVGSILIEEPENHLSHTRMQELISSIKNSSGCQLFISTHNNLICSGINLQKVIFMNSSNSMSYRLSDVSSDTSTFFQKAPDNNLLQFILARKVILVEGAAEFLLLDEFYRAVSGRTMKESGVHLISVGGLKFKRYLEIAQLLNIKTAVITDNDGDYSVNVGEKYSKYKSLSHVEIFSDTDNDRNTFEVCLYNDNKAVCEALFNSKGSNNVLIHMLNNKAECAFQILLKKESINIPEYIKKAIEWINQD